METNPYLKTEIGNIVRSRSELYQNLQLELNLMEERLGEIERSILSLSNARLNKNLLPPLKLREILQTIEKQLPANYTLLFSSTEPLWPYYSLLSATATFDTQMDSMVVRLSIPLVDVARRRTLAIGGRVGMPFGTTVHIQNGCRGFDEWTPF